MPRKKIDELTKAKIIYTVELGLFAVVFLVLGILFIVGVIIANTWKQVLFLYATLIGGILLVADFLWATISRKRRKKVSLLDKSLLFPIALLLIAFDIYVLAVKLEDPLIFQYVIGADFLYLTVIYTVEAIYHWYHPVPGLLEPEKKEETKPEAVEPAQPSATPESKDNTDKDVENKADKT